MSFGFADRFWMAEKLILNSHPVLAKRALVTVMRHLEQVEKSGDTSPLKILEIMVQVASTGEYIEKPGDVRREYITLGSEELPEDLEAQIQEFVDQMDNLPSSEEDEESYEDFLKRLGIPNVDDFKKEDEDDDPQSE